MKFLKYSFILLIVLSGCMLRPIIAEYDTENIERQSLMSELGNGKILIYNDATILHTLDNTDRLNIWIDGKALGQLKAGEYTIVNVGVGSKNFKVLHLDMFKMESTHLIDVARELKVISIAPTPFSNEAKRRNKLPKDFDSFSLMNH